MTTAVILGRSEHVWQELDTVKAMMNGAQPMIIAINKAGRDYPGMVRAWVSFHPHLFPHWLEQRQAKGLPPHAAELWSGIYKGQACGVGRVTFPLRYVESNGGSSGKLAVDVALKGLNVDKVVLCGIPLQHSPRYDDSTNWNEAEVYHGAWQEDFDNLTGRVKSMSGWTQELLGPVTPEWLNGAD